MASTVGHDATKRWKIIASRTRYVQSLSHPALPLPDMIRSLADGESLLERKFAQDLPDPALRCLFPVIHGLTRFVPANRITAVAALRIIHRATR